MGNLNPWWNQEKEVDVNARFEEAMELVRKEFVGKVSYFSRCWWPARLFHSLAIPINIVLINGLLLSGNKLYAQSKADTPYTRVGKSLNLVKEAARGRNTFLIWRRKWDLTHQKSPFTTPSFPIPAEAGEFKRYRLHLSRLIQDKPFPKSGEDSEKKSSMAFVASTVAFLCTPPDLLEATELEKVLLK